MASFVALATACFGLPATRSLKDKRQIVRSGVAHLRNRFNVSAAEVGALGTFRRAELAIAAVGNNRPRLEAIIESAVRCLERDPRLILENLKVEFL
jgi:uncharacterized protein YlxP (DUF503 family)